MYSRSNLHYFEGIENGGVFRHHERYAQARREARARNVMTKAHHSEGGTRRNDGSNNLTLIMRFLPVLTICLIIMAVSASRNDSTYIFLLYCPPTSYKACDICPREQTLQTSIKLSKIFSPATAFC